MALEHDESTGVDVPRRKSQVLVICTRTLDTNRPEALHEQVPTDSGLMAIPNSTPVFAWFRQAETPYWPAIYHIGGN